MKYLICVVTGVLLGFFIFCLLFRIENKRQRTRKQRKERKETFNFTKAVLVAVLFTYFIGLAIGIIVTLKDFSQFGVLATYIAAPTTTVIALYCWKAKAENLVKIKQGYQKETGGIPVDLNNINI